MECKESVRVSGGGGGEEGRAVDQRVEVREGGSARVPGRWKGE